MVLRTMAIAASTDVKVPAAESFKDTFSLKMLVMAEKVELDPEEWSYDDCVARAIANNTDVRRTYLSILQADEDIASAKDAWLPTVSFSTSQSFENYPSPSDGIRANSYGSTYGVNAGWTVWEGNIRKYRLESARLIKRQQEYSGADQIKNLKLGILQAYLNILYAEEAVSIARQTLEVSESQTVRARRLMESGRSSAVDFAQIESQEAQDRYSVVQAEGNYASAVLALKKFLMLGIDSEIRVASMTFSECDVLAPLPGCGEVYDIAAAWLPGIKSNDLNRDIYANDIRIAKAGRLPTITLQGGVGTGYTSGGPSWTSQMGHGFNENVGLSVTVPIFDGNSTKRAVAKARLASLEYDITARELLEDLSQTIENLYIESDNSRSRYLSGLKRLEAAEESARLVDRQFDLGLVNPLELLTAHNDLLNARLELLQSKYMAILSNKTINYYATSAVSLP